MLGTPDYTSVTSLPYANTRAQLTNDNVTEEQSIHLLRTIWRAANDVDIGVWENQVEVEREQREHLRQIQEEEQDRIEQEHIDEEESARKEEKKKHKHKFAPIPEDTGVPDEPSIIPSSYAIRKLDKGEYLELWYFTNNGLDQAHRYTASRHATCFMPHPVIDVSLVVAVPSILALASQSDYMHDLGTT